MCDDHTSILQRTNVGNGLCVFKEPSYMIRMDVDLSTGERLGLYVATTVSPQQRARYGHETCCIMSILVPTGNTVLPHIFITYHKWAWKEKRRTKNCSPS